MNLREKLRTRAPVFGTWTSLGHPSITEAFTRIGPDFVAIDIEHSTIGQEQSQRIIAAAHAGGCRCLPRVASHDGSDIRRVLDSGADGVIVPNVTSRAEVEKLVESVKYPPEGKRSYGVSRAQGYGFDFPGYVSEWNLRSVLIVQIESVAGVERAEEIIGHPAVDGAMVGPYDISGSLGIPGQIEHPRVREACQRVVEACRRLGKACGTQLVEPTSGKVADALATGYTFVVLSSDVFLLWKWGEGMRRIVEEHRRPAGERVAKHA